MKDQRIDAYIANAAPFARPILRHLRAIVHAGCPEVQESLKWGMPHFEYKGILCSMAAFKQHCVFGFWKASLLGGGGTRGAEAMGQFGRITSVEDLPDDRTMIRLVKEAVALNEKGVKAPYRKNPRTPKPAARTPSDLLAALEKNRKAKAAYDAFSPSHRREYIEWITQAKRDETRQRRVETAIQWIAEGKALNWKYQ